MLENVYGVNTSLGISVGGIHSNNPQGTCERFTKKGKLKPNDIANTVFSSAGHRRARMTAALGRRFEVLSRALSRFNLSCNHFSNHLPLAG
jgi:hypothetical protein